MSTFLFSSNQHAWAELLLSAGLKHDRPPIRDFGPLGLASTVQGGQLKIPQVLDRYPMPEDWKVGDGLPAGLRF